MANPVERYVNTRQYLDPALVNDLEEMVAELVKRLLSGELKAGTVNLQLSGTLDKDANPELTMTIRDSKQRQKRYSLSEAYQMRLPGLGEE